MKWEYHVKLKHLMTEKEDIESIRKSMKDIAEELRKNPCFNEFNVDDFYAIPQGNRVIKSSDYANKLIELMFDYADIHKIWIN